MISSSKAGLRGLLFLAEQRPPAGITVGKNTLFYHFSFDRRKTDDGKRWSAKAPFGDRAYFQENPYISNLIIKEVRKEVGRVQLMMVARKLQSLCLNLANFLPSPMSRMRAYIAVAWTMRIRQPGTTRSIFPS